MHLSAHRNRLIDSQIKQDSDWQNVYIAAFLVETVMSHPMLWSTGISSRLFGVTGTKTSRILDAGEKSRMLGSIVKRVLDERGRIRKLYM